MIKGEDFKLNIPEKRGKTKKRINSVMEEKLTEAVREKIHELTGKKNPSPEATPKEVLDQAVEIGLFKKGKERGATREEKRSRPRDKKTESGLTTVVQERSESAPEIKKETPKKLRLEFVSKKEKELGIEKIKEIDPNKPETYEGKIFITRLSKVLEKRENQPTCCLTQEKIGKGIVILIEVPDGFWIKEKETIKAYISNLEKIKKRDQKIYFKGKLLVFFKEKEIEKRKLTEKDIEKRIGNIAEMMKNRDEFEKKEIKSTEEYLKVAENNLLKYLFPKEYEIFEKTEIENKRIRKIITGEIGKIDLLIEVGKKRREEERTKKREQIEATKKDYEKWTIERLEEELTGIKQEYEKKIRNLEEKDSVRVLAESKIEALKELIQEKKEELKKTQREAKIRTIREEFENLPLEVLRKNLEYTKKEYKGEDKKEIIEMIEKLIKEKEEEEKSRIFELEPEEMLEKKTIKELEKELKELEQELEEMKEKDEKYQQLKEKGIIDILIFENTEDLKEVSGKIEVLEKKIKIIKKEIIKKFLTEKREEVKKERIEEIRKQGEEIKEKDLERYLDAYMEIWVKKRKKELGT